MKENAAVSPYEFDEPIDIAWCPGCGNFAITKALKLALVELGIRRENLVMVSGIGQAAKSPHYINASFFNGLHGRSLPAATAVKASNPGLTVIAESGDGCTYGEGGGHFLPTVRRNPDITNLVHDNRVYGLTKGQASPTAPRGFRTPVQVAGVYLEPFNPIAVSIALNASFVARAYSGDVEKTKEIMKKAISHRGYALIDILQPCVSFNKVNTYQWYKEHTYYLGDEYDPRDREAALWASFETEKLPLGIIYTNNDNPVFEDAFPLYKENKKPLYERTRDPGILRAFLKSKV
ncbi:MAG: 2-oxoacid ferredoxin oxidoreductase [Spirochaetes bacterium]|nr:MAG: 2-oxoacid ferredoxin oxidoreductase [Spirochaetota bacterium]